MSFHYYSIQGWILFMRLLLKNAFIFATRAKKTSYLSLFSLLFFLLTSSYAGILEKSVTEENNTFDASEMYQALAAEIYNELGDQNAAVDFYFELSTTNNDPAIAKRVTELATATGQIAKALESSKRWVALNSESLEANQYLALLLIRNSHFKAAAQQLDSIRNLIEKTSESTEDNSVSQFKSSESLTFIGAMLAAEAHHKKAYKSYKLFIKTYITPEKKYNIYQKQQQLIAAQLAMKAKQYSEVIRSIKDLEGLDDKNYVDAKVMHAKALHKLQKNNLAIEQLKIIQDHPEAVDSHRLELVRLLVLTKQKNAALPLLEKLVEKHPKNFELLKSFIALQIDQSRLSKVNQHIKRLSTNTSYSNEAHYFNGEFAEKLGQLEKALDSYIKVKKGSYVKNAHKKVISLTKKIDGQSGVLALFIERQKSASSLTKQAYWIKLQADDLFESHRYLEALSVYNKAIRLAPEKSRYRYKRGLVNERLGNLVNAEADFNHVLSIRQNDFETLNALGYMLSVHTDRLTEAKAFIDKAYKLKPNDPLVLDSLGFVLYKKGDLGEAEKFLRKSFKLSKKPEIASHLITVLAELNQYQEAKSIYLEMQKIYPNSPSLKSVKHRLP